MSIWLPNDPTVVQREIDERLDDLEDRMDEAEDMQAIRDREEDELELDW